MTGESVSSLNVTVKISSLPSTTASPTLPCAPGSTVTIAGLSLSKIEPVAATPSTLKIAVSVASTTLSSRVNNVTVNSFTPAGTVNIPSLLIVTSLLKLKVV